MAYHLSVVKFRTTMPDAYHHGDLRRALLDAAGAALAEGGVGALSLRDLARRVGVSPTAPYHHFGGKADLVHALACDALDGLDRALAAADASHADPMTRLRAQGVAYVRYAVEHPEPFRLAFRPEMGSPFADLDAGVSGAAIPGDVPGFRHLQRVVADLVADPAERLPFALAAWGLVHGLAALLVDGPLAALAADPDRLHGLVHAATAHLQPPVA